MDAVNSTDDSVSTTEPDELGPTPELKIGDKIEVYWPLYDQYYPGSVSKYAEATGKHRISYDGGQVENLKMDDENWRILTKIKSRYQTLLQYTRKRFNSISKHLHTKNLCYTK